MANYIMRQSFFDGDFLSWAKTDKLVKLKHRALYDTIPCHGAQSIIKKLGDDWKSFFEALKKFKASPELFRGRPRPPKYAKKLKTYLQPFQSLSCIESYIVFPIKTQLLPIKVRCCETQRIYNKKPLKKLLPVKGVSGAELATIKAENLNLTRKNEDITLENKARKILSDKNKIISEIRIVPQGQSFWLEVVYDDKSPVSQVILNKSNAISLDLGVNNL